jgi:hypothetical protein
MVNDSGQIYTIEGVAAAILMVVTAYLAVSSTTILTQQDVHIIDMQMQQLGNDALAMMDTPDGYGTNASNLSLIVNESLAGNSTEASENFKSQFLGYLNATTNTGIGNNLYNYNATVYYRNRNISDDQVASIAFDEHPYYHEHAVTVSRWVYLPNFNTAKYTDMRSGNQSVLLEVLLWRV